MFRKSTESLDKTRDKQPKTERARPEEFGRGSLEAQVEGPVFAIEEELAEKEKLLQALKQVEPDKSIQGLEKQKEIYIKLLELDERRKERIARERGETIGEIIIKAKSPENREIEINLEQQRQYWQEFYNNHNFKDKVDIPEPTLTNEQIQEIQTLIKKGFVDKLAIIPDHLSYQELEKEMTKGYKQTFTGSSFDSDGGFQELDKLEQAKPTYRLIFYKKVQNLENDKILKATRGKSPDKMDEYLKQTNKQHQTELQGISLKDYLIIQREMFETENKHMDESGWSWCLKSSFSLGRVAYAGWDPARRQLNVSTLDSSNSSPNVVARLSPSFLLKK